MNPEVIIPFTFFACLFGIIYVSITTRHRERMAMIEKGADPSLFRNPNRRGFNTMKLGLLSVGIAVGILSGSILHNSFLNLPEEVANFSMIFLFGGLALILSQVLENRQAEATAPPKEG